MQINLIPCGITGIVSESVLWEFVPKKHLWAPRLVTITKAVSRLLTINHHVKLLSSGEMCAWKFPEKHWTPLTLTKRNNKKCETCPTTPMIIIPELVSLNLFIWWLELSTGKSFYYLLIAWFIFYYLSVVMFKLFLSSLLLCCPVNGTLTFAEL